MPHYKSVLTVDDDASARAIYRAYFLELGVEQYLEAPSGLRAIEMLRQDVH